MDDLTAICQANKELAQRINEEARANASSPFAGKFVGIANGQVVVVADDLTTISRRLGQIEPDPRRVFCLDAGHDPNEVTRV